MIKREFCTTREASKLLGVSLRTVQLWVENGTLDAWKTEGGHRRVSLASVEEVLAKQRSEIDSRSGYSRQVLTDIAQLRVLVVEDDNTLLKLYRIHIDGWGLPIKLTTAASGYDGLVLVGREQPDLLITDLRMPGMDGFEMVRALYSSTFREGMEIVVVSGLGIAEIAERGGLPAGVRVMHKPIPFAELKLLAEGMLTRRRQLAGV